MALAITHLPCYIIQQKYAKENLSTFLCLNIKQLLIKELDAQFNIRLVKQLERISLRRLRDDL